MAAALVLAALPSAASASVTQESMFQDDPLLVYGTPEQVEDTLNQLQAFGVDRIRLSIFWKILAPANDAKQKPNFDATDPAGYQKPVWERYDALIRSALSRGILVNLNITSPIPRWAAGDPPASRQDLAQNWAPNAEEFGKFVQAVGKRYSGTYQGLPRVDYWSIWNEPNQAGWLTPQWTPDPRDANRRIESAPSTYRALAAAMWSGLAATGHGTDTILVGETAPQGQQARQGVTQSLDALHFIRQLYCLDDNLNLLKGSTAQVRGCPQGNPGQFVAENPALFRATGFAHHPYDMLSPPARKARPRNWVTMANLADLSRTLRRIYARYGAEDADAARRPALSHRVRLPDVAGPDPHLVRTAGLVPQRGRVHRLPQPVGADAEPVPARRRQARSGVQHQDAVAGWRGGRSRPG